MLASRMYNTFVVWPKFTATDDSHLALKSSNPKSMMGGFSIQTHLCTY